RRRHTRSKRDWSSDVCSSDLVVPQKDYLIQLREFNDDRPKHDTLYSNEPTVELFYQHFKDVEKIDLQYDVLLDEEHLVLLLHMRLEEHKSELQSRFDFVCRLL